jgi:hypothetical protein
LPVIVLRRGVRGVLGEALLPSLAANVKTWGTGRSEPADCGGVKANAVAKALASVGGFGLEMVGVRLGKAELGVSG